MLKRTITLLGLTITVGALLLTLGCGGHNGTLPTAHSDQFMSVNPARGGQPPSKPVLGLFVTIWGDKFLVVRAEDPDQDRLQYKIVMSGNPHNFTFDQTQSSEGWLNNPWSNPNYVNSYASGQYGWFKLPRDFPKGAYQAQAYAYDGTNWTEGDVRTFIIR
jgi:hypothetical protein